MQQNKNNIFCFYEKTPLSFDGVTGESCNVSENIHCGKVIADEYAGELICQKCGVVLEEKTPSFYRR